MHIPHVPCIISQIHKQGLDRLPPDTKPFCPRAWGDGLLDVGTNLPNPPSLHRDKGKPVVGQESGVKAGARVANTVGESDLANAVSHLPIRRLFHYRENGSWHVT